MSTIEYKFKAVGQHEVIQAFRAISRERDRFIMKWIPVVSLAIGALWFAGVAQASMKLAVIGAYVAIGVAGVLLLYRGLSELLARNRRAAIGVNSDGTRPTKANVYDKAFVYIDGKILGEAECATLQTGRRRSMRDGAIEDDKFSVRIISFIPDGGFEFDAIAAMLDNKTVELKIAFGGSGASLVSKGIIDDARLVMNAKDPTKLEFEFAGSAAKFVTPSHSLVEAARSLRQAAEAMSSSAKESQVQEDARLAFAKQRTVTTTSGGFVGVTPVQS
jgi:hypothetical protein